MKKLLDFIVFSNLLIAFAAMAMLLLSQYILGVDMAINADGIFLFLSTYLVYNYLRFSSLNHVIPDKAGILLQWISRHLKFVRITTFAAALGVFCIAVYFLFNSLSSILVFGLGAVLSSAYLFPLTRESKSNLRSLPFLKTFIVAITWAVVTVLPVSSFTDPGTVELLFGRFFFIWAITLPFDIRDIDYDNKEKLTTVVGQIGIPKTKLLSFSFLIISAFFHYSTFNSLFPIVVSIAIPALIISRLDHQSSEYWYTLGLDSTMIIQLLVFLSFS
ncbi:MAG: hypothetical protein HKN22_06005 [Bacteroidia bacterium]|nr:hypothetical protein [Bacteroidia bacterium]